MTSDENASRARDALGGNRKDAVFMKSDKTPYLWAPFLSLVVLFGLTGQAWAGLNLEVPIEMIDRGISSQTSTTTFRRSAVILNEADYDGDTETYAFEIVAKNKNASQAYAVYLLDKTYSEVKATILVPANTTDWTRLRTPFTSPPAAGADVQYRMRLEGTVSEDQLKVSTARMVVLQTNATKTRIQIPLLNHGHDNVSNKTNEPTDETFELTWSQSGPGRFSLWKKDSSAWGDMASGNAWTFEVVIKAQDGGTASACLYNTTLSRAVPASVIDQTGVNYGILTVGFPSTATDFDDLHEFDVRHKISSSAYSSRIARACLYVRLTDLKKGEVSWRFSRKVSESGAHTQDKQRVWLDTNHYSNPEVYHESTGYENAPGDLYTGIWDGGTSDGGTGGTELANAAINFDSTSRARQRTTTNLMGDLTSGHRYIHHIGGTSGAIVVTSSWLVVKFSSRDHYVWADSPAPTPPYLSWDTAAHTIQAAINGATAGEDVTVRPGASGPYTEAIVMKDGVNVVNRPGDRPAIDGGGTNTPVTFTGAFALGCTLEGFDISNGGTNGGIHLQPTGAGITNTTAIRNCAIHGNSGPGIKLDGILAVTAPTIDNDDIYNNGEEGLYIMDGGSSSEDVIITHNDIHGHMSKPGINLGGASYVVIGESNDIYSNYAGIAFDTTFLSTQPVTITNNNIYGNSQGGIYVRDPVTAQVTISENDIYQNTMGGIGIRNACNLLITRNEIRDNGRGGIHTGSDVADGGGFFGSSGSAVLTIRQNKVHHNGGSNYGGGIDVRHAAGTITNNLVYENYRGGIRFGDHVTAIVNNTTAKNGQNGLGGGIIYDDLAGAVNDPAAGNPPAPLNITNNISVYNEKAAIRACFTNTLGAEERDYNLVYANNGTGDTDCGYPDSLIMSCTNKQFGGCGGKWNPSPPPYILLDGSHNIIANPLFKDMGNDDYRLQKVIEGDPLDSPAVGTGVGGADMGAYGGAYPMDW